MNLRHAILSSLLLAACAQAPVVTAEGVQQRYEAATQSYEADLAAFESSASPGQAFQGNLAPLAPFLRATMRQRRDAEAQQRAAVYLATLEQYGVPLSVEDLREVASVVLPSSSHWVAVRDAIRRAAEGLPADEARALLDGIAANNADRAAQAQALIALAQLERRERDMDAFRAAYERARPYSDVEGMGFLIRLLNPDNNVAVGKTAPAFAAQEVGSDRVVTSESLRGRYVLLDFWATWCAPCIVERASLTRAQVRFGGERFTIVSLSLDNTPEAVIEFRRRRWPMNWTNLYLPGSQYGEGDMRFEGEIARAYEINWIGVPQLVLVSPEGEVLALRDQLEGPLLEQTLAAHLGPPT